MEPSVGVLKRSTFVDAVHPFSMQGMFRCPNEEFGTRLRPNELDRVCERARDWLASAPGCRCGPSGLPTPGRVRARRNLRAAGTTVPLATRPCPVVSVSDRTLMPCGVFCGLSAEVFRRLDVLNQPHREN